MRGFGATRPTSVGTAGGPWGLEWEDQRPDDGGSWWRGHRWQV